MFYAQMWEYCCFKEPSDRYTHTLSKGSEETAGHTQLKLAGVSPDPLNTVNFE